MPTQKTPERGRADYTAECRRHGIRPTHQRTEILREVAGSRDHPDAEAIFAKVRRRVPALSLDTVYRALHLFETKGVVARVGCARHRARFEGNTRRHHHFICVACGRIEDFYSDAPDRFELPPGVRALGRVEGAYLELRGRCRRCVRAAPRGA